MSELTGPTPQSTPSARRTVVLGVLLGALGTLLAVLVKARCGIPAGLEGQYLQLCYSDIPPLYFTELLDQGAVPYLDRAVAYPPLIGLAMWLAALPATTVGGFYAWTGLLLVISGGVVGGLLASEVGIGRTLVFAAAPTLWISGAVNWDLPSLALATAGLVAHRRGRDGWAGAWLALGAATKLWPLLLLPPVVLAAWAARGWRRGLVTAATAVVAWSAVNLPVVWAAPDAWLRSITYNRDRPADWDSLWRILGDWAGTQLSVPDLNLAGSVVTLLGLVVLLALATRWDPPQQWHLVGLPILAWFLLANKVWSPQFSLWLLPLFALATPSLWGLVAFYAADVAVSVTRFPYLGSVVGLEDGGDPLPFEVAVVVRAAVLAVVAVQGWRRAARPRDGATRRLVPAGTP